MSRLLKDLNQEQRAAVCTTEGPLLIIAGAGSGKTRVLTRRLAYILSEKLARPDQILAVTFTNKAAAEMKKRTATLVGGEPFGLQVCTFHSFCARLLRSEAGKLGYESSFTIFDADDSQTLVKNCIKQIGLSPTQFAHKAQLRKISNAKNLMIGPESFAKAASGYFEACTAKIYTLYQNRLKECGAMDFDDLLFSTVRLLTDNREVGDKYRSRFKYIMVDEYQDTNHVQYMLLKNLLDKHMNLCVVGDEDQSIYGWRGADISNILNFENDYPGAALIKLEQNYRSTAVILRAASAVIENNTERKGKTLRTTGEEGAPIKLCLVDSAEQEAVSVLEEIERLSGPTDLKETAIVYRTNAQSRPFEEQLRRRKIPYQIVGGISFYQRKEIKDLMAYLRLLVNPRDDVSCARIINYPRRGIGDKTVRELTDQARIKSLSLYEGVKEAARTDSTSPRRKQLEKFCSIIEKFTSAQDSLTVDQLAHDLVGEVGLVAELLAGDEIKGQTRVENVEAFIEGLAEYAMHSAEASLEDYLAEISLFTGLDDYREIDNKVTLMTVHTAKGLEYDRMFIVGLEEGLFPLKRGGMEFMELEEERRLFYVGITRARKMVWLSAASSRFRFGSVGSAPSRFLKEIPPELIDRIDLRATQRWEGSETPARMSSHLQDASIDRLAPSDGVHYDYSDTQDVQAGRIVQHPTFGRGKVVKSEGFGDSLRLEIAFSGIGLKKILAKYARLKVVG